MDKLNDEYFFKHNETDTVWWYGEPYTAGPMYVSFDKKKLYNLFGDYPDAFSPEEKEIFDRENPFWAEFFKD